MLKLSNFFQQLTSLNIFFVVLSLLFLDILGAKIKSFFISNKKIKRDTRLIDWLIGLAFFVFVWFIFGFFVPVSRTSILVSALILLTCSLGDYIKNKLYLDYWKLAKQLWLPAVLVLPLFPAVFVKASLPPYYFDEMAYHFISPFAMLHQIKDFWTFNGGLYMNIPRLMDDFYILGFSVFYTYSITRILQFFVLITSLFEAFLLINKYFGKISSFIFILILSSLPLELPFWATVGYVDIPTYSFLLLGLIFGICFFRINKKDYLTLSLIFWAMSVGTKYTTLVSFGIFLLSLLVVYLIEYRSAKVIVDKKLVMKVLTALIVFGGYWYIKNFVIYGNPIYPFLFRCWGKYAGQCGTGSSFFGSWTDPINLSTLYPVVIRQLLPQNVFVSIALLLSVIILFIAGSKKERLLLILLSLPFLGELLILKSFSGFAIRYQQHLQLYLILIVVIFLAMGLKYNTLKVLRQFVIFALLVTCTYFYFENISYLNSRKFVTSEEINYSVGKVDIYYWIKNRLPDMYEVALWCENPPGGSAMLARFDPDMIWYKDAGYVNSYLLACSWRNPGVDLDQWANFVNVAKQADLKFWIVSSVGCLPEGEVKSGAELQDASSSSEDIKRLLLMRKLNNAVVCNSEEVVHGLYYFDYSRIKTK